MHISRNLNRVLASLAGLLLLVPWASARMGQPPRSVTGAGDPLALVDVLKAPAIDGRAKRTAYRDAPPPGPVQFAEPHGVQCTLDSHGTWEALPDGGLLWRLRVEAPGSTDLNLGFTRFWLPEGATLHILSEDHDYFQGPYTADDNKDHGELWTPVVPGGRAVIELYVPASAARMPELWLTHVNRGFLDAFRLEKSAEAKQQFCNIDVACPQADPWQDQVRSVARYSISGNFLCTGTMVADVPQSLRSFFLTANHCDVTSSSDASVVVYWNYESPACGQLGGGSLSQNQSGSTFRASKTDVDMCLIELDAPPAESVNIFYSGWDRSGTVPASSVGIHHPNGDEKAISFNTTPLTTVDSCISFLGNNTHWEVDDWEVGTTESGSSGSGLWDSSSKLLVGFLSGGEASCFDPDKWDCYGKFSVAWASGSSASSRLSDWLDPGNTGVLSVQGYSKLAAPAPTLTYPTGGESFPAGSIVNITWDGNGAPADASLVVELSACGAPGQWAVVGASAPGATTFPWKVPRIACSDYQVRVKQNSSTMSDSDYDTSSDITITAAPSDAPTDVDLDGRSDVSVYGVNNGTWYILQSGSGLIRQQQFGYSQTLPVAGDYDNDGVTDLALYEVTTGKWYVIGSQENFSVTGFGYAKTHPVPGDYDGDGEDDYAVWEPSTGTWYILASSAGFYTQQFGFSTAIPVPGDYDGDGSTDFAVFDPANGRWYMLKTSAGFELVTVGSSGTVPAPCDYDADGKCDQAVYRPSGGLWTIRSSRSGQTGQRQFGFSTAAPVPGDYDGDSICETVVFERATGNWYLMRSSAGFLIQNWGYSQTNPISHQHLINRLTGLLP